MRDAKLIARVTRKETNVKVPNDVTEDQLNEMAATNAEQQLEYEWFVTPPQPDDDDLPSHSSSL